MLTNCITPRLRENSRKATSLIPLLGNQPGRQSLSLSSYLIRTEWSLKWVLANASLLLDRATFFFLYYTLYSYERSWSCSSDWRQKEFSRYFMAQWLNIRPFTCVAFESCSMCPSQNSPCRLLPLLLLMEGFALLPARLISFGPCHSLKTPSSFSDSD